MREVFSHIGVPVSPTDTIIRQLQESRAEVVIVDVPSQSASRAIRGIELIRATTQIAIFASSWQCPRATDASPRKAHFVGRSPEIGLLPLSLRV